MQAKKGSSYAFFTKYRPQFASTTDVTGEVELPEGTEMVCQVTISQWMSS